MYEYTGNEEYMKAEGRVFKFGDNVDTDVIIPARYLNSSDPAELATHCMEDIDKDFVKNVNKAINAGDDVAIDFDSGVITDKTTGHTFQGQAFPEFMQKIIKAEGLVNYINNK